MHSVAPLKLACPTISDWFEARIPGQPRSDLSAVHVKATSIGDVGLFSKLGLPGPLVVSTIGSVEALWIGPDQWLLLAQTEHRDELSRLQQAISDCGLLAVPSESRLEIVDLNTSVECMSALTGLPPGAVTRGRVARTRLADIPVVIVGAAAETTRLIFDRTFAPHVRAWLDRAI